LGILHEDQAMKLNAWIASIVLVAMAAAGISLGLAASVPKVAPKEATPITQTGDRALRRSDRGRLRRAPVADAGAAQGRELPEKAARFV
jgi:hypothetical protein